MLCDLQGPLGFWSQQSFEGAHKLLKNNFSKGTNHGGGKSTDYNVRASPAYQMLSKHCRVFVLKIRQALEEGKSPLLWDPYIRTVFAKSIEERRIESSTFQRDTSRVNRELINILEEANAELESEESANLSSSAASQILEEHNLRKYFTPPDHTGIRLTGALRGTSNISLNGGPCSGLSHKDWFAQV